MFCPFIALPATICKFLEGEGKLQSLELLELTASDLEDILLLLSLDSLEIFLDKNLGCLKIVCGLDAEVIHSTLKKQDHKEYTAMLTSHYGCTLSPGSSTSDPTS